MKIYNHIALRKACAIVITGTILLSTSCTKSFLDVDPQAKQPAVTFWKTQDDAQAGVYAIYGNLRSWANVAFPSLAVESIASDEADKGSSTNDASYLNDFENFTVTSTDGQVLGFWEGQYQNINLCNQVLDNIPGIEMDPNLKSRLLAEAKFVRAYSYFRLVRAFGGVRLHLTIPKTPAQFNMPRSSREEVYAAIEKDLDEAAAVLPVSYPAADRGRATQGAALALHAKVAMYQKKWAQVLSLTNTVMTQGYSLLPDYESVFRLNHENSSESIFEIQCEYNPGTKDASNSQYAQVQGVRSQAGYWGFNTPSLDLANAFETGDPRREGTILFVGTSTPQGDLITSAPGDPVRYNHKPYVPFATAYDNDNPRGGQQNVRVIRYSDVLLMNAEAANELNNSGQAIASLEQVRLRARQGNPAILPKVTTTDQTALRAAIYHERRVELAMESDRYFDVIRQGRAAAVFGPKGWKANKNEVWPIPNTQIELSVGVLTQNPGY
ncbi:RagB/SusD family nutrient uptake outer membrane protein [Pedobacter sp. PLR]|uniref:RagB/SusD family nutrient uptake outer membrane protein n=1 Tax=Pedobacter sp. PLR TaxID=2994465 RepID=UPI0022467D96|nr:RagB/SusD family nutrient uptake outer membrane protein [Pedobacter sp. PLR]MCX2453102.1 RagB/SusD family nutrient uptake outer membrane protein [Pedobacter sp. PLR]